MATGEGKTLVAIMALYLNALAAEKAFASSRSTITWAGRNSEWMGKIFEFLGLTIGCLDTNGIQHPERRAMYECDITYGATSKLASTTCAITWFTKPTRWSSAIARASPSWTKSTTSSSTTARRSSSAVPWIARHRYDEIKTIVFDLVRKQNELVNRLVSEAEKIMRSPEGLNWDAGLMLLRAQRGLPKHEARQDPRRSRRRHDREG